MTDHIPIVPRLVDENLIQQDLPIESPVISTEEEPISSTIIKHPLFKTLKLYLMPAIFVICVIIIVYILYRYFFVYRNKPQEVKTSCILPENIVDNTSNKIIEDANDDPSNYIIDTTDEEDNDDSGEDSDAESDESDFDDKESVSSSESTTEIDAEDMSRFSTYLNNDDDYLDLPPLMEEDETRFEELDAVDELIIKNDETITDQIVNKNENKSKRTRKSKRVSV
jgi:hypothetical protein